MSAEASDPNDVQSITRIMLRPIGSALPLGFFAFGVGVILLSALELHWIPQADVHNIPMVLFGFVAPLEFLACIMAFFARDTASATTLGIFALSWIPQALVMLLQGAKSSFTLGIFLSMAAAIMVILAFVAYAAKPLLTVILVAAFLRTTAAAVVEFGVSQLATTSAVIGIVLTVLSLYGGAAFLLEDARQKDVIPLFRRGAAERATQGSLRDQLVQMPNKPGVRRQL